MSLAHASVSVLRTCLVQAVRSADAFALRLLQRTENALQQALAIDLPPARRHVLNAALHNLQQHRTYLINSFPQNLLEALVLSARQPFSFTAKTLDTSMGKLAPLASMAESAHRQLHVEQKLAQMVAPQVELALADLDALMSGAQGLEWAQPECNPLRLENYVRALGQSLTAVQPAVEVADCWQEFMGQQLGVILSSEYSRAANLLRQQGVPPARYGSDPDGKANLPQCLLTLRLLQEMASDQRWIEDMRYTVPQSLTDSMLAGWPATDLHANGYAPTTMLQDVGQGLQPGWTSYSATALQTIRQPLMHSSMGTLYVEPPTQAPRGLVQVRTLQRMMSHMTGDGRLLPAVQGVLRQLEPVLLQLVERDPAFFEDRLHPARQLLDELTARSLWFSSESALGFAHFINVAQSTASKLASLQQADAQVFAQALQFVREQWPPEGRISSIGVLSSPGDDENSTQGLMSSALGLMDRHVAGAFQQEQPNAAYLSQIIRTLPSAKGAPEDILDFVTGPWAEVIAQAQRASATHERDPGGYLALVPSLLWSVSPQAAQDVGRLVAIAPRLQRRLARGLHGVGRSDVEIAALAARVGSLQQRVLDAAEAALRTRPAAASAPTSTYSQPPSMLAGLESAMQTLPATMYDTLPVLTDVVGLQGPELVAEVAQAVVAAPVYAPAPAPVSAPAFVPEIVVQTIPADSIAAESAPASDWPLGVWVELHNERQQLRTKLTWVSPQQSLFLFTAEDGSTQSMTRRMRDKLLAQGQLRRLEA